MGVSGQLHTPAALNPWKEVSVSVELEIGWPAEQVWTLWSTERFLTPVGNRTPPVQTVACRYTDICSYRILL
jgi:hypothetical protein